MCISRRGLYPHTKLYRNQKKLFVDGSTDVRTDIPEFQSIRSSPGDDLKIETRHDLKIEIRQAVNYVQYYPNQQSVLAPRQNGGGDRPRKLQFSELQSQKLSDLGLGRSHTGAHGQVYPHTKLDRNRKMHNCRIYTTQHRTVLIIFPLILPTIITAVDVTSRPSRQPTVRHT